MDKHLDNNQYSHICDYDFASLFQEVQYNGNTLSDSERKKQVSEIDETIAQFSEELPLIHSILESAKGKEDEFQNLNRTVISTMLFVRITMIDILVASKYFLLADKDYDKRFMRGKLYVILNEGFKKVYGFEEEVKKLYGVNKGKKDKTAEWEKLMPLLKNFPEKINLQYQELTFYLDKQSKSSSWWRNERNYETHLVAEELYESRQEEIIESKVMIDSMKLFTSLLAIDQFLTNVHACIVNYLNSLVRSEAVNGSPALKKTV